MRIPMDDSLNSIDKHLLEAYQNTSYLVFDPPFCIRIGQYHPPLDECLTKHQVKSWIYITAFNPQSQMQSTEVNEGAQAKLEQRLSQLGLLFFSGHSTADAKDWPPEPSFLVLGATKEIGVKLADEFGQLAFLCGELGGWCELVVSGKW